MIPPPAIAALMRVQFFISTKSKLQVVLPLSLLMLLLPIEVPLQGGAYSRMSVLYTAQLCPRVRGRSPQISGVDEHGPPGRKLTL